MQQVRIFISGTQNITELIYRKRKPNGRIKCQSKLKKCMVEITTINCQLWQNGQHMTYTAGSSGEKWRLHALLLLLLLVVKVITWYLWSKKATINRFHVVALAVNSRPGFKQRFSCVIYGRKVKVREVSLRVLQHSALSSVYHRRHIILVGVSVIDTLKNSNLYCVTPLISSFFLPLLLAHLCSVLLHVQ